MRGEYPPQYLTVVTIRQQAGKPRRVAGARRRFSLCWVAELSQFIYVICCRI
jgi:hypothetical protein